MRLRWVRGRVEVGLRVKGRFEVRFGVGVGVGVRRRARASCTDPLYTPRRSTPSLRSSVAGVSRSWEGSTSAWAAWATAWPARRIRRYSAGVMPPPSSSPAPPMSGGAAWEAAYIRHPRKEAT